MKKIILLLISIIFVFTAFSNPVKADSGVVAHSAQIKRQCNDLNHDPRVTRLKIFLNSHNSPLTPYSEDFVYYADMYDLDYRFVASITGVESTFGKRIPYGSYNAYGWANGKYYFQSWEDSIGHVSKTLRDRYYDRGAENIAKIARRYAPPSSTWGWKVKFFMTKIDKIPVNFDLN